MRKFTLSMLVLFVSVFFLSQSVFSQNCEDFDALTPGDYVAGQLGGYWTTWGGTPGGADDALVSDANSNSPSNSFVVDDGAVDLIYELGDAPISSGQWLYSHYMFVPAGFSGYFNVQTEPTPGVGWNLELNFDDDGTGHFEGQSSETFTYTQDVWFMVEILYDFDAGMAYVYFDGVQIIEFVNAETIGGIDYYGATGGGTPGAYYDDVCFDAYAPTASACEDFDSYTVGDYVAVAIPGWTTWSNNPGSSEDGMITDAQANSPANSFLVDGSTDLVDLFGDENITSGAWYYSNYMYVPAGYCGYYNLQKDIVPGVEWGFQVMFDADGSASVDAGAQAAATWTYAQDTWHFNELIIDIDNDYAEYYFNGELIVAWAWSLGTFGDPGAMTLGAANYYAWAGLGDPMTYWDDVCFEEYVPGGDCEDFDALTVGDYVAGQLGGYWTTWGGTPGGADDAMVSDVYSNSPSNSFVVDGGNVDLIFQLGDEAIDEGQWLYSNYIYIPTGFSGYFNIQTDPTPGVDWNLDIFFNDDGTGEFGTQSTDVFDYAMDTWILVEINYDFDAGLAQVLFDGVLVTEFVNTMSIGGVDYYGYDGGGTPGAYYDDVCFGPGWEISTADCENFDALTVGDYVAGQLGGYWTTWGGTPGGADDAFVTDAQSNSPSNSFVVDDGAVDLIYQLGDEALTTGQWLYSHYMYVPSGFSGYFNVQTDPEPGVDWNLELHFDDDGTGFFEVASTDVFEYEQDVWFLVEIYYDLDAAGGWVLFDGVEMTVFESDKSIGGIDYYGATGGGTPGAYYDDVCFGLGKPIGIQEEFITSNSVIYPNPARDQITIESESIIDEVRVYNNMGQLVYSGEFNNDQIMVNTSNFITGMYIVQIRSGEAIEVRKLIIE